MIDRVQLGEEHWMWRGAVSSSGHGSVRLPGGHHTTAARAAWAENGNGRPTGRLRNRCGARLCVRPSHWTDGLSRGRDTWTTEAGSRGS